MKRIFIAAVIFSCVAVQAQAGWVEETKDGDVTMFSEGLVKTKSADDPGFVVYDAGRSTVTQMDSARKVYVQLTIEEACRFFESMLAALKKNAEAARKGQKPRSVAVQNAGDGGTVAGHKTDKYKIMVDGKLWEEQFIARDDELAKANRTAMDLMRKYAKCASWLEDDIDLNPDYRNLGDKGWLMKNVKYNGSKAEVENEIVKLEKRNIPPSEFVVPPGYKKVTFQEFFQAE